MGIVSFSHSPLLSVLLAPVHALAAWFVPVQRSTTSGPLAAPAGARRAFSRQWALPFASGSTTVRRHLSDANGAPAPFSKTPSKRPACNRLKVVRELDAGVSPACAGRMVISGRMADVCAELERMAQREAAAQ